MHVDQVALADLPAHRLAEFRSIRPAVGPKDAQPLYVDRTVQVDRRLALSLALIGRQNRHLVSVFGFIARKPRHTGRRSPLLLSHRRDHVQDSKHSIRSESRFVDLRQESPQPFGVAAR